MIHVIYWGDVGPLKTKESYRTLPVSEDLKQRMLRISGSEWIFISDAGTPVCGQNGLRRYLRPACEKLGIKIGGWHDFRHTLTTRLRKAHTHPRVLADILGHSKVNLAMDVYDRSDEGDIAAALLPNRNLVAFGSMNKQGNLENQPN